MVLGKRGLLVLGAVLAAGILAAVALGQDAGPFRIAVTVAVKPDKAGTPSHPRGIRIDVRETIDAADDTAPPMPRSVDVWLPKGWVYNGAKYPACTQAALVSRGPAGCPPQSVMSHGAPAHADVVGITSPPRVTVINGGRSKMYFFVVLQNPARVQAPVKGTLTKPGSSRWSYRLHADIPEGLQVVAGIPISLTSLRASFGRGDWIATTSCPSDHRWQYRVKTGYPSGAVVTTDGAIACRS